MKFSSSVVGALLALAACDDPNEPADDQPVSCAAWGELLAQRCGDDAAFEAMICEDDRLQYEPIGCGAELAEWYRCQMQGEFDCNEGSPGCSPDVYGRCLSQFAQRTSCSRLPGMDAECPEGMFSYGCLGQELPAGCTPLESPGVVPYACCPSFASGGPYFELNTSD